MNFALINDCIDLASILYLASFLLAETIGHSVYPDIAAKKGGFKGDGYENVYSSGPGINPLQSGRPFYAPHT